MDTVMFYRNDQRDATA